MIYIISFAVVLVILGLLKYIKKNASSFPVFLIFLQIIYTSVIKFFIGYLSLPSFVNYLNDVILLFLIVIYFIDKKKNKYNNSKTSGLKYLIILYLLVCIFSYMLNLYSPFLFLWGFRNNFRFIIFAYLCTYFIKKEDLKLIFPILTTLLILNFVVVLYQSFFINFNNISKGDFISGLYSNGLERGGNSSLCWLLCIGCTYSLANYLYKKISFKYLLLWFILSFLICSLNETKIFFIEIVIVSIITILLCKKSLKTFAFLIIGIFALMIGINILYTLFPAFDNFFSFSSVMTYFEGSYSGSNLSRSNAISYILNNYLNSNTSKLFGIGLGNADFSAFDIFTSKFYLTYHSSLLYSFFSSSMVILETGILGVASYLLIFVDCIRKNFKKYVKETNKEWFIVSINISIISIISFFVNQSLRIESIAYFIFFIIAIVYNRSFCEVKINE